MTAGKTAFVCLFIYIMTDPYEKVTIGELKTYIRSKGYDLSIVKVDFENKENGRGKCSSWYSAIPVTEISDEVTLWRNFYVFNMKRKIVCPEKKFDKVGVSQVLVFEEPNTGTIKLFLNYMPDLTCACNIDDGLVVKPTVKLAEIRSNMYYMDSGTESSLSYWENDSD